MQNPFTAHPREAGETYWQHMRFALRVSGLALQAGAAACVHAILPFLFQRTASRILLAVADRIRAGRPAVAGVDEPRRIAPSRAQAIQ